MIPLFAAVVITSCITCHPAKVQKFRDDVHAQVGLSCHDCHGGNPDPNAGHAHGDGSEVQANPYVGQPKRADIPGFCGKCHGSADYMKRFNPAARVDQVAEYHSSVHGQRLAKGDENVATCIDCHSVHDIRRKTNPESPVYATHVAETCSRCHSDAKRMAAYHIPTDQYARWRISVHAKAMFEKERPDRADVQRLPRQSRRDAARRRERELRLRQLPRTRGRVVPQEREARGLDTAQRSAGDRSKMRRLPRRRAARHHDHALRRMRHLPREPWRRAAERGHARCAARCAVRVLS